MRPEKEKTLSPYSVPTALQHGGDVHRGVSVSVSMTREEGGPPYLVISLYGSRNLVDKMVHGTGF